ncbi:MAG: hypothetical protein JXR26_06570 [Balneolaceae bacterium]|nr:hypothetical protein [Balneolaceae bacterium]
MKKLNLTIFVFFLMTISCKGQSTKIDTFSGEVKINNQIVFDEDSKQATKNVFGQPDNITTEYWEMSDKTATNYIYTNGAKFQFTSDTLERFVLTSSNYYVQMGSFKLQVGNNISSIQNTFPKSYDYRESGTTSIALGAGDYHFLLIKYDSNNVITRIESRHF